jgi:protein SCO1/2
LISENPAADQYQFVFVTVDPAHDSPAATLSYLAFFDPAFLGLSGSEGEISKLARSMSAHYERVVDDRGRTQFEHTTSVFVVNPQGRLVAALPAPHEPASMASMFSALRQHLDP